MHGSAELLRALQGGCVARWPDGCLSVTALIAVGAGEGQAAAELRLSTRTVRRRLEQARETLSEATGLPVTTIMLVAWFWLHKDGCSRAAAAAVGRN